MCKACLAVWCMKATTKLGFVQGKPKHCILFCLRVASLTTSLISAWAEGSGESETALSSDACRTELQRSDDRNDEREKKKRSKCQSESVCVSDLRGAPSAISKAVMPRDQRSL